MLVETSPKQLFSQIQTLRSQIDVALEERKRKTGKTRLRAFTQLLLEATEYEDVVTVLNSVVGIVDPQFKTFWEEYFAADTEFANTYAHKKEIESKREYARLTGRDFDETECIRGREILSNKKYNKMRSKLDQERIKKEDKYLSRNEIIILSAAAQALQQTLENIIEQTNK